MMLVGVCVTVTGALLTLEDVIGTVTVPMEAALSEAWTVTRLLPVLPSSPYPELHEN
jgi:hypothetical protein